MRLLLLLPFLLLMAACETTPVQPAPGQALIKPAAVTFYVIHETPGPNLTERKVEATGETILLGAQPDLTNSDVAWAEMAMDRFSTRSLVLVHFSPVGADKLAALTRQNIGRRLAILVSSRVIATPLITTEIRDGRLTIQGFRSPGEARWVADSLARWLR